MINLSKNLSRSFLMVTHDISVSAMICDRLIVMDRGRVIETGATKAVISHPQAELTKRLVLVSRDIEAYWENPQHNPSL